MRPRFLQEWHLFSAKREAKRRRLGAEEQPVEQVQGGLGSHQYSSVKWESGFPSLCSMAVKLRLGPVGRDLMSRWHFPIKKKGKFTLSFARIQSLATEAQIGEGQPYFHSRVPPWSSLPVQCTTGSTARSRLHCSISQVK